ncbi:MAG: hypothetical protein WCD67_19615, partial [Xanthobacteraceae bacterium]
MIAHIKLAPAGLLLLLALAAPQDAAQAATGPFAAMAGSWHNRRRGAGAAALPRDIQPCRRRRQPPFE